jgi:hypothetical protein
MPCDHADEKLHVAQCFADFVTDTCAYYKAHAQQHLRWSRVHEKKVRDVYPRFTTTGARGAEQWPFGHSLHPLWDFAVVLRTLGAQGLLDNAWNRNAFDADGPRIEALEKVAFALKSTRQYRANAAVNAMGNVTVGDLLTMNVQQLIALANRIWDTVLLSVPDLDRRAASAMYDPAHMDERYKMSLPTSPDHDQAMRNQHVLFRCDTRPWRTDQDVPNVPGVYDTGGFLAKWEVNAIQPSYRLTRGTRASEGMMINSANSDFFNETGVCVARSIRGATCFPELNYFLDAFIYAVDVESTNNSRLEGYDTEAFQIALVMNNNEQLRRLDALWRHGEKAYRTISSERVIAWRQLIRKGYWGQASGNETLFSYKLGDWNFPAENSLRYFAGSDKRNYVLSQPANWVADTVYEFKYDERWRLNAAPLPDNATRQTLAADLLGTPVQI